MELVRVPLHCQLRYDTITDPKFLNLLSKTPSGTENAGNSAWQFKQALAVRALGACLWLLAELDGWPDL